MIYKNAKGEIVFVILIAIVGLILAVLALGLATGENRFLGTFLGQYSNSSSGNVNCGPVISLPVEDSLFAFPYTFSGKIITGCGWSGHEGVVGSVEVIDAQNTSVLTQPILATSSWMASEVTFSQNLNMPIIDGDSVTLRFHNTNPSGENPLFVDIHVELP